MATGATHKLYSYLHDHWNYAKRKNGKWLIYVNGKWSDSWAIGSDEFFRRID